MVSRGAGGCDFVMPEPRRAVRPALWTAASLPSVIPITPLPPNLADRNLQADGLSLGPPLTEDGPDWLINRRGCLFRLHILEIPGEQVPCVVLPLDRVFEIRAAAALRLWRGLTGRLPGRDPAILPAARRDRLLLALRALDGRLEKASYRDIAEILFGTSRMPERGWKTHDLRDRTVRLARLGQALMQGGYRRLLVYPFRGRI
jgi:Uncharacterized conserved protein (DUF2285)